MGHVLKLTVLIVDHSLERFEHWQSAETALGRPTSRRCRFRPAR
jgi:hypothetical protein